MRNGPYELIIPPKAYPGTRYRERYAYEHHVVWWKRYKKKIPAGFEIHHLDGNHRNNKISNLKLVSAEEHRKLHGKISRDRASIYFKCGFCLVDLVRGGSKVRSRLKRSKSGKLFCSRRCGAKDQYSRSQKIN